MILNQSTSNKWLKSINQQTVLRLIYSEGPISRVQLADKTGLTQQTITNIVNRLLQEDVLQENVPLENGVGRKPVPLEVKSGSLYAIGIEVAVKYVRGTLVDFQKKPHAEAVEMLPLTRDEGLTVQCIKKVINELLSYVPNISQLKGIGCSIQGLVDSSTGIVLHSPGLQWIQVPLAEKLEGHYNLPVYLENDANLLAVVENLNGSLATSTHSLTFKFDHGVGGAHIMNNKLNTGANHVAGELGHIKAFYGDDAKACHCGSSGCLTTLASSSGIKRNLCCSVEELMLRLQNNDPLAVEWSEKVEKALSMTVSNVITFLNPDHVLFTGKLIDQLGTEIRARLRQRIMENIPETCRGVKLVVLEQTPNDSILAAGLVMNQFFDVPSV
jgi:predicted NBD/HSP70 family sugar kinase